uniref:Uncharacterized protein n=1 Tax=Tanacetum cinerariifolium TaxID=118510 RepID=A0A699GY43_TANCI|nr:hypothetical protein [Tanacetum cinerariifolium]
MHYFRGCFRVTRRKGYLCTGVIRRSDLLDSSSRFVKRKRVPKKTQIPLKYSLKLNQRRLSLHALHHSGQRVGLSDQALGEIKNDWFFTGVASIYIDLGDCDQRCRHCGAMFWYEERDSTRVGTSVLNQRKTRHVY